MRGTLLEKYGLSHLNVTHVSQQFWCERQVELSLACPREDTEGTIAGKEIHRDFLLELVREATVETETREDAVFVLMLNLRNGLEQLIADGMTRELYVFGRACGFPIAGIIDELSLKDGRVVLLDHKTRLRPTLPPPPSVKPTEVQVMLYRMLLEDLREGRYTYEDFAADAGLEGLGDISQGLKDQLEVAGIVFEYTSVERLARDVFEAFRLLPPLSDFLIVRYIHQATGDHIGDKAILYDTKFLAHKLSHAGKFWEGQRKAARAGFREKWKCNYCEYKEELCMASPSQPHGITTE
jgi:exonuclease V